MVIQSGLSYSCNDLPYVMLSCKVEAGPGAFGEGAVHVNSSTHHAWWGAGDRKRVRDRTDLRNMMETHLSLRETVFVSVSTFAYCLLPFPQLLTSWKRQRLNTQYRYFLTPPPAFLPPRMAAVTSCLVWGCVFLFSVWGNHRFKVQMEDQLGMAEGILDSSKGLNLSLVLPLNSQGPRLTLWRLDFLISQGCHRIA